MSCQSHRIIHIYVLPKLSALSYATHLCLKLCHTHLKAETKELFCRSTFQIGPKSTMFVPKPLDGAAAAETQVKRGYFGVAMRGNFDKLPTTAAKVLFETHLDTAEVHLRPLKVKLYFMGHAVLEPGKYYKLH